MVKHIVIWQLKDEFSGEEKISIRKEIKESLEGLLGKINGLLECSVETKPLPLSNGDVMLTCLFTDSKALEEYQSNPLHMIVKEYVGSVRKERICFDFEI